jgi:hypothetical protein
MMIKDFYNFIAFLVRVVQNFPMKISNSTYNRIQLYNTTTLGADNVIVKPDAKTDMIDEVLPH